MTRWLVVVVTATLVLTLLIAGCAGNGSDASAAPAGEVGTEAFVNSHVVFGFSELGMNIMNRDYSHLMLMPPAATLRAQVIRRGAEPQIVTSGVTVAYNIQGNTLSSTKTNFWDFAQQLLGTSLAPNRGMTGQGLWGPMTSMGDGRWQATAIPLTPMLDTGTFTPYQIARIQVRNATTDVASTRTVLPVSWALNCKSCHGATNTELSILQSHDAWHGTSLATQTGPVACGSCHQQQRMMTQLGPGVSGLPPLSRAIHHAHASRVPAQACYYCHPSGSLRDVHAAKGMTCRDCHGNMDQVAAATRQPWVDEPRCGNCHSRAGFQFEEAGKLYRDSRGHNGVACTSCHGAPHAVVPTKTAQDNQQNTILQGYPGTINKCSLCHGGTPGESFNHTIGN